MAWFVATVVLIVAVIIAIVFLNRFYRKSTREVALIRTGAGGQQVILDGGCMALPFLHKVSEVNMRTTKLEIERVGPKSIITKDRLRVDANCEFYLRVNPTKEGVATAAQALAGKTFRASDLAETLEGKLTDAMLSVAAGYTMDSLQDERGRYVAEVSAALEDNLASNGLTLESVSLTGLDQTPFHALDESNAFNALGMRRLAEIIAANKKERAVIESDAEISVRQSQLDATKRRLLIEQEEEEAAIAQQKQIETARATSNADVAERQAEAERRRENARISREQDVKTSEIERDRAIRALEVSSTLATETARVDKDIQLSEKYIEKSQAQVRTQAARAEEATAEESVDTAREAAAAERGKQIALIRANEQAEVDNTRVKSEAGTILAMAHADAKAVVERAKAAKDELLAKAEGTAKLVLAENAQSGELMKLKTDLARIDALPEIVEKIMKPAEKIETIRINQVTGFNSPGGDRDGSGQSSGSAVNQAVEGVMSMALQLPAVKKLGEEIGINIGSGIDGLSKSIEGGDGNEDSPEGDTTTE